MIIDFTTETHSLFTGRKNGNAYSYKLTNENDDILLVGRYDQCITSSFLVGLLDELLLTKKVRIKGFQSRKNLSQVIDELKRAKLRMIDNTYV